MPCAVRVVSAVITSGVFVQRLRQFPIVRTRVAVPSTRQELIFEIVSTGSYYQFVTAPAATIASVVTLLAVAPIAIAPTCSAVMPVRLVPEP